jgi:hypothetical protein
MKLHAFSLLAALALPAQAHDSWFAALPSPRLGEVRLALGTGNQFPKLETTVGAGALVGHGCRHGSGAVRPLIVTRDAAVALELRSRVLLQRGDAAGAISCWVQMPSFEVEVMADKIGLYLDEINASTALRETWAAMRARGLPWRERYAKHARIESFDARLAAGAAPAAAPVPMGMDIVLEGPLAPPRAGDTLAFTVLRDGQPLAGQPVELRNDRLGVGVWLRTDARGRASVRLPFAASYLLRGVDLRAVGEPPESWDSRFVTLAFTVR